MVHLVDLEDAATVSSSTSRVEDAGSNNGFLLVVSFRQFWWTLLRRSYKEIDQKKLNDSDKFTKDENSNYVKKHFNEGNLPLSLQ